MREITPFAGHHNPTGCRFQFPLLAHVGRPTGANEHGFLPLRPPIGSSQWPERGNSQHSPIARLTARMRRFRPFVGPRSSGKVRPNCDIGRAGSGRPLPDPTADLRVRPEIIESTFDRVTYGFTT